MIASDSNKFIEKIAIFLEDWVKPTFKLIIDLRVQVAIALAIFLVYTKVDQTIEVYRSIALDQDINKAIAATGYVSILTFFVWYTARFIILEQRLSEDASPQNNQLQHFLIDWSPRILGIIPILSLGLGLFEAWHQSRNANAKVFLIIWLIISLVVGVLILALFIFRTSLFNQRFLRALGAKSPGDGLFNSSAEIGFANSAYIIFSIFSLPLIAAATNSKSSGGVIAILILPILLNILLYSWHQFNTQEIIIWGGASLLISAIVLFVIPPTAVPNWVGAISVIAIAFTILVVVFSTIYNWAQRNNIPALTILVGLVVLSSIFNLNDNHRFRQFAKPQNSQIPCLKTSFQQWLASRPDLNQYSDKPYPVYVASAQGGGIYAAYHAATALSKLTEHIPSFPQHIFAISGVSGGSLGASTFASLVKANDGNSQNISNQASQIFDQDLLSSVLTLGFFPDLIQRFIPFSIYDWDRANGLEIAFENAWDKLSNQTVENPFKQSFYQHWQPEGIAPALVLNTTVVENGERLVISPFQILLPNKEKIVLDESNLDLRLSTAAGLSARFPFVTPVGWYQRSRDGSKLRLADGGYFDNSGIPTSIDIGRALQKIDGYGKTFELIYLAIVDQPTGSSTKSLKSQGGNEVLSPIRALFNAREARSRSALELSTYTLNDGITDPFKLKFRTLLLQKAGAGIKLPLGWQLASTSQKFIDEQSPEPSKCNVEAFRQAFSSNIPSKEVNNHNNCVAQSIADELS